jgi:hypothetical protein
MDEKYLPFLIEVGVRVFVDLLATCCPTGMRNSTCGNSCFGQHLFNDLIDASSLLQPMLGVLDQSTAVGKVGCQSIDPCTVIAPVFEQLYSLTKELLKSVPIIGLVHLFLLFFGEGSFQYHPDDTAAFGLLLIAID